MDPMGWIVGVFLLFCAFIATATWHLAMYLDRHRDPSNPDPMER